MQIELNNIKYSGYSNIDSKDICVVMSFFNPLNYNSTKNNISTIIKEFSKTNIPYYIIELIYPKQKPFIKNSIKTVKGKSAFFAKENLWNIAEKLLPEKYSKIIFMDCDVLYTNSNWVDEVSTKLDSYKIVHAAELMYRDIYYDNIYQSVNLDNTNTKSSIVKALKTNQEFDFNLFHPGYNICIDRNTLHNLGGFFEEAYGTAGDTLFWMCLLNFKRPYCCGLFCAPRFKVIKESYIKYRYNFNQICSTDDIDYIENNYLLHLYHGSPNNREYGKQDKFIPGPFNLYKNKDGVIEMKIIHPTIKDLTSYFQYRQDDD